jgi:hypothetical protein
MLVVFRSATNMVVNERAFIENVPGTRVLRLVHTVVPPTLLNYVGTGA